MLKQGTETDGAPDIRIAGSDDDALFCADCGASVTRAHFAIRREGEHEHLCANPAGVVFHVRLFSDAPGAEPLGPATDQATWFPGTTWRMVLCRACEAHLGWVYDGDGVFFGLVKERIV